MTVVCSSKINSNQVKTWSNLNQAMTKCKKYDKVHAMIWRDQHSHLVA